MKSADEINVHHQTEITKEIQPYSIKQKCNSKRPGKQGLHGDIYHTKLIMLFLKRGLEKRYSFKLSAEIKEAKKFDDIIFEISNSKTKDSSCSNIEYKFLQAKHKDDESKLLKFYDLLTESDADYSLVKYFFSYLDLKKEKLFKNGTIKDVIVCTNIDMDLEDMYEFNNVSKKIKDIIEEIKEKDYILDFENENLTRHSARYKFNNEIILFLKPKLENYNLTRLARRLVDCFLKNNSIKHHDKHDIFYLYHIALAEEVIDIKTKKFFDKFVKNEDLSNTATILRTAFAKEIEKKSNNAVTLEKINEIISTRKLINDRKVGLNLSKNFGQGDCKKWPDNSISEEDIKEFLKRLVFAVNQPNEEELGKIIGKNISKEFNFASTDYVYSRIFVRMLEWLNGKGEEFISFDDGESLFQETKEELSELELTGLTEEYTSRIQKMEIRFKLNIINEIELDNFLKPQNLNYQILNIITEQPLLTIIKVLSILQHLFQDNYIYIEQETLVNLQVRVMLAFKGKINLLIIECNAASQQTQNIEELLIRLSKIAKTQIYKKIILINQKDNYISHKLKSILECKYHNKIDDNFNFTHLEEESQNKLLREGTVIFQGREVSLGLLFKDTQMKKLIDGAVLSAIIRNEKIIIGEILTELGETNNYYIERSFMRRTYIKQDIKKENSKFLIIEHKSKVNTSMIKFDQDMIVISGNKILFKMVCDKLQKFNVHWFKKKNRNYIWQESNGSKAKLFEFIDKTAIEYLSTIDDIQERRIVIIAAEPGMGKSTLLTKLIEEIKINDPTSCIIRINLLDCSNEFYRWKKHRIKIDGNETKNLIFKMGLNIFTKEQIFSTTESCNVKENKYTKNDLAVLESELFNYLYSQGKITLLLDGFDEIIPDYSNEMFQLLEILKCENNIEKLWVTTRNYNILKELEDKLSTISYKLNPFSKINQANFLQKFFQNSLQLEEIKINPIRVFSEEILKKFSQLITDQEYEFMAIPLQICMFANYFQELFKEFYNSKSDELSNDNRERITEKLNLVDMYEDFIKSKFYEIRFGQKRPDINSADPDIQKIIKKEYKEFFENHMKLGLYEILEKNEVTIYLSESEIKSMDNLIEEIQDSGEKTGIIVRVINNRPRFVHRTFAEYFVARYFWENFKKIAFDKFQNKFIDLLLLKNLLNPNRIQICKFFISIVQKDLEDYIDFVDKEHKLTLLFMKIRNKASYYFIKYIPDEPEWQPIQLLWSIIETLLSTEEEICKENIIKIQHYLKKKDQVILFLICAEKGYIKLAKILGELLDSKVLEKKLKNDYWEYSPLWIAAENSHLDIVRILIEKVCYNVNWNDIRCQILLEKIIERKNFQVLRSCLKLNIIDVSKNYQSNNEVIKKRSPLSDCIRINSPSDIIELMIEKTDYEYFCTHFSSDLQTDYTIVNNLLEYDIRIIQSVLNKGIELPKVINEIIFKISKTIFIDTLNEKSFNSKTSKKEVTNLFDKIELLLKNGSSYNYIDPYNNKTTLQYVDQLYYIQNLLERMYKLHNNQILFSSNMKDLILKLIIDGVSNSFDNLMKFRIIIKDSQISLQYENKISHTNDGNIIKINTMPKHAIDLITEAFNICDKKNLIDVMLELQSYIYKNETLLEELIADTQKKIYTINYEFDYEASEYDCLSKPARNFLGNMIEFCAEHYYNITDLIEEILKNIAIYEKVINNLVDNETLKEYTSKEIFDLLNITNIDVDKELKDLISKICKCGGLAILIKMWQVLIEISEKIVIKFIEELEHSGTILKIYKFLEKLHISYNDLVSAIANNDYNKIENIIKRIEPELRKSVINGQDENFDSLIHYAASNGNGKTFEILLKYAPNNPNTVKNTMPIHLAAAKGHKEIIELLTKGGCNINVTDANGQTPLHFAAKAGEFEMIKYLIEKKSAEVHSNNNLSETPLHCATAGGHLDIVKYLIEKRNADVNAKNNCYKTPLDYAIKGGYLDIVIYLIEQKNVDDDCYNYRNETPLHYAAESGHLDMIKYFTEKRKADVNAKNNVYETPLHYAIKANCLDIVIYLEEQNTNINAINKYDETALHYASYIGCFDIMRYFIEERNAEVNSQSYGGETLLCYAAAGGHLDIMRYLIEKTNVDVKAKNNRNETPLHCATKAGHIDIVRYLIEKNCVDVNANNNCCETPLHYAAAGGYIDILKYLIEKTDSNENALNNYKETPLHYAALAGCLGIVKYLVEVKNCDINAKNKYNSIPLHSAAYGGHLDIVMYLIEERNSDVNAINKYNETPLHYAAFCGCLNVVKYLIEETNADTNANNIINSIPLHYAAEGGSLNIVRYLIEKRNTHIKASNKYNSMSLHFAAKAGHLDIVKYLVEERKADVNEEGNCYETPLHYAVYGGSLNIIKYLIKERNADVNAKNIIYETPLHYAIKTNNLDIVIYLIEEGNAVIDAYNNDYETPLNYAVKANNFNIVKYLMDMNDPEFSD